MSCNTAYIFLCAVLVALNLQLTRSNPILQNDNQSLEDVGSQQLSLESDQDQAESIETPTSNNRAGITAINDANRVASCLEPPPRDLHKRLMKKENMYPQHPMFAIYPFEETNSLRNGIVGEDNPYPFTRPNFTCPLDLPPSYVTDINERSLCPWTYTLDNDANRFPKVMAVASCRCQGCIETVGGYGPQQSLDNNCRPVTYRVRVLKRLPGCVDGYYQYRFAWEEIPVACVCVRPRLSRPGPARMQ